MAPRAAANGMKIGGATANMRRSGWADLQESGCLRQKVAYRRTAAAGELTKAEDALRGGRATSGKSLS